jgi:PAS domain S-box-containing protein
MEYQPMSVPTLTAPERHAAPAAGRFFDELPALACLIDSDGCLSRVNGAWLELLGYPVPSLIGKPFSKFFHRQELPLLETGLVHCGPRETWDRFEARFRCADGSYKWLLWQFKTDHEKQLVYAVAFDVSDRKQQEAAAQRRLTAATFQAQIWEPFTKGSSTSETLTVWVDALQRHVEARDVQIWIPAQPNVKPALKARASASLGIGHSRTDLDFLERDVRQVFASRLPLVIRDIDAEPRLAPQREMLRERQIKGIILYPVLANDQPLAAISVFLSTECGAAEGYLIERAAFEMSAAWSHLAQEDDLRATKRQYDALFRSANVGISRVDAEGNVRAWNAAAEKILGWRTADMTTRKFPIAGNSERELFDTCIKGAFAGKTTARVEARCWSSNGKAIEVALSISPLLGPEEGVSQALVVFEDLTEPRRTSRRLRLYNTIMSTLGTATSVGQAIESVLATVAREFGWDYGEFWQWDKTETVLTRATTWQSAAANAVRFAEDSRSRDLASDSQLLAQVLRSGKPRLFAGCARNRDFPRCDLAARCGLGDAVAVPVATGRDPSGVLIFFASQIEEPDEQFLAVMASTSAQICQFLDRSRMEESLREAEENLLQAKKMDAVGRLVGGVVHDFNNVLTVILGCGEIARDENLTDKSTCDLLDEVVNAGKRAAGLTRQLLAFCRKEEAEQVVLNLNVTVTEMEKLLRRLIGEHIELETVLSSELGCVCADPGHIEQLVMNLVVNARDAMAHGGRLVIKTQPLEFGPSWKKAFPAARPGWYALLSISDTGCGIDEATQAHIFEPFFTTKAAGKGTGMGLATVCEIVKDAGAHIAVESQLGKGTTFRILFPTVTQGLTSWQVKSAPAPIPRGNEVVLVVEDDLNVRRLIVRILKAQGYTLLEAAGAQEAIELCRTHSKRLDLLITDVVMPRMNGRELAGQLKAMNAKLKVLYVSGYSEGEYGRPAGLSRDVPFLPKPFTSFDLARKVRDVCDS